MIQLWVSFSTWTHEAMETKLKEVKTRTIPIDIMFHISAQLEILDMENWAEAVCIWEQFRRKIPHAKQMRKHPENLRYMNARMSEALAATDFKLTCRTM